MASNITADVTLGEERTPKIKKNTDWNSMTIDSGYFSEKVIATGADNHIDLHFTDMTGREPKSKLPVTAFEFDAKTLIINQCPHQMLHSMLLLKTVKQ